MRHASPVPAPVLPLAVSIAGHALAGLLLARTDLRAPAPPPPPAPPLALEVELLVDTPAATATPVAEPRAIPRPRPPPASSRRPPPPPALAQSTPGLRRPSERERPRPPLSLALDFRAIDRLAQTGVLRPEEASPTAPPPVRPRPSTFGERLATRVREAGARRNVALGKVHPQVFDYMRDAHKVFAPDPEIVSLDPRAPGTVKSSLRQWGGGLAEAYRSWRRELENPHARRREDDPDRRIRPDILEHYNRILEGNRKAAEGLDAQVCLLVEPGATPRVELGKTSGNQEVDQAAIDALTRASHRRQSELDLKEQRACYSFAVKVVRVPPLPVVGCTFDEMELTASCYYPLKKGMEISVSLDSVDYDAAR
jgi:hypothetical protein